MKKLPGKITISRVRSSRNFNKPICIELRDTHSTLIVCSIYLSLENFAYALTGEGRLECEFEFDQEKGYSIGKRKEVKEEIVPFSHSVISLTNIIDDRVRREFLSQYEVDGWKVINDDDFGNHHKRRKEGYLVSFHRYVDINTPEEDL